MFLCGARYSILLMFPFFFYSQDKVKINSLSMVADDHSESKHNAGEIYKVIRAQLLSKKISSDHLLPLVYLIDSILKNVKGVYIPIIEQDASTWLSVVYEALSEDKRVKLKKVYNLWKDMGIFSEASWKRMGESFSGGAGVGGGDSSSPDSNPKLEAAGIVMGVRHDTRFWIVSLQMSMFG